MSQVAFNPCARCGAPATRRCSGCQSQVYCNIACQTQDWKAHKTECNDTRMTKVVDRAAHLLQKVYFMFREHAFQKNMINVGTEGFDLALHESKDRSKITRGGGIFINFPTDLISCGHERKAVLSWMASKEPSGLFLELVRSMFPEKYFVVEEVHAILKNKPVELIIYTHDPANPSGPKRSHKRPRAPHTILLITSTKTKRKWVLDITSPQFGIMCPFNHWHNFYPTRFRAYAYKSGPQALGHLRKYMSEMAKIPTEAVAFKPALEGAAKVQEAIQNWCLGKGTTVFEMLRDADCQKLEKLTAEVLELTRDTTVKFVEEADYREVLEEGERAEREGGCREQSIMTQKVFLKCESSPDK